MDLGVWAVALMPRVRRAALNYWKPVSSQWRVWQLIADYHHVFLIATPEIRISRNSLIINTSSLSNRYKISTSDAAFASHKSQTNSRKLQAANHKSRITGHEPFPCEIH
jgi:hypothetical protein